jgi:hypothetical protein
MKAMTEAEYLDPRRFPLTTQVPPLSLDNQMLIDALNRDEAEEAVRQGEQLTEKEQRLLKALREKAQLKPQSAHG